MADSQISNRIWNIAGVLRDGGVSYGDYLEQITFLLFLKMVDENIKLARISPELPMFSISGMDLPANFDWNQLASLQGEDLITHYEKLLTDLSKRKGMIGEIYRGARNKVEKASLLKKVIDMIGSINWSEQSEDVKGDIYESLLQRIAQDTKSGAGQYFTPRPLINVIVKCVNPHFSEDTKIADPCCGSGGFLLAARKYIGNTQSEKLNKALQESVFHGTEYVESTYRMCLMNLLLHGIGTFNGVPPIKCQDSLAHSPGEGELCNYVLTNPPFGKKSSQTVEVEKKDKEGKTVTVLEKEKDSYTRQDFIVTTNNKQLNFVQHIKSMLKVGGQAAIVLPDNVLFEGNAGEVIRQNLLKTCDLHTILRLPAGLFYAQSVKANVLFFEKRPVSNTIHTKEIWVYDYRTNIHHTLKQNPLKESDLDDFVACYNPKDRHKRTETYNAENNPDGRWRKYSYEEIIARDKTSLNFSWIKSEDEDVCELTINEKYNGFKKIISFVQNRNLNPELLECSVKHAYYELLDLAISGKLVEQNPTDEPASILFQRILDNKKQLMQDKQLKKYDLVEHQIEGDYELPNGWCWVQLGSIANFKYATACADKRATEDSWLVDLEDIEKETGTLLVRKKMSDVKALSTKRPFSKGNVLYSKLRPYLNKVIVADSNGFCTTEILALDFDLVVPQYAQAFLMSRNFVSYVMQDAYGVKMPRADAEKCNACPFPLPPLAEQERIVKVLDEILPILKLLR